MAFDSIRGLFSKAEVTKQPEDVLTTLSAEQRNTLNVLRDALQTKGNLTGEQIGALSFVKDALRDSVGEAAMEEAVAAYFKEVPVSRLGELKEIVSRQDFLRTKLMQSMADVDKAATVEALAALDRAKSSMRVLSRETFSSKDVEDLCAELKDSEEYQQHIINRIQGINNDVPNQIASKTIPSQQVESTIPVTPSAGARLPKEFDPGQPRFKPVEKAQIRYTDLPPARQ